MAWIRNDLTGQDYGLDYFVQTVESHVPTGVRFGVQLKGKAKPKVIGSAIHFPFPTKNLGTYLETEPSPVLLVVVNTTTGEAFYVFLQRYANENLKDEDWAPQATVVIRVPLTNRLSDHDALRNCVHEAHEYM